MTWKERKTIDIELKELPFTKDNNISISNPSKLRIIIPGIYFPVDIGAWCYLKRRKKDFEHKKNGNGDWQVKTDTFEPKRKKIVIKYAEYLFVMYKLGGRNFTIQSTHNIFLLYINWCDKNYPIAFNSNIDYVKSLVKYTANLNHRINVNEITSNSASSYQKVAFNFIFSLLEEKDTHILSEINIIKANSKSSIKTILPSTEKSAIAYATYESLFKNLINPIKDNKPFPWLITVENEDIWIFPNSRILATKKELSARHLWKHYSPAYDYKNGKLFSLEEIKYGLTGGKRYSPSQALEIFTKARILLDSSNSDKYHYKRIFFAKLALQSFIMMFSANTGMNLSSIASLIWNDNDHKVSTYQQGFKTIKARANNKEVEFKIGNKFYPLFKKYLNLRRFLISAHASSSTSLLFFRIANGEISEIKMGFSHEYNKRIKTLFGLEINLTSRSWRALKSDWLIRNTDIPTTALILQNSTNTVIKNYIEGSEDQASDEISNFYKNFHKKVIITSDTNAMNTSVGRCKEINNSKANTRSEILKPDCKTPEGCLFCEQ